MKAEYIDDSRSYILRLEKDEKNFTYITLDTGSASTIFGINILSKTGLTLQSLAKIDDMMNLLKIQPVYFNSASNTEMKTYPLVIKNFKLGEELIDELYFYLLMNDYNPDLSVLGVDFINYCSMHKELNSDIELRMLDSINYEKKFKENAKTDKILSLNLIMDKLNTSDEYETPRDIAAALRNLYHIDLRGWEGYDRS